MKRLIDFIRNQAGTSSPVPLHAPQFGELERRLVNDALESTFVSTVGQYVDQFETEFRNFCGAEHALAVVNGSCGLHLALHTLGVGNGDLVITQSLTFVATCNAIWQTGARPVFVDVHPQSLGMDPAALKSWLDDCALRDDNGVLRSKASGARIAAVVPMHTLGHPVDLDALLAVTQPLNLPVIEDAAESLGSFYKGQHTGTLGDIGVFSFNGNKTITTGGGGMILCRDDRLGGRLRSLGTTAKQAHAFRFYHDEPAFNYRLPNLNAALGCAQMSELPRRLQAKRTLAKAYKELVAGTELRFVDEPDYGQSNFWLNAVLCEDRSRAEILLRNTHREGIMTRPVWEPMHQLPMYRQCERGDLPVTENLADRLVCLPSSASLAEGLSE